MLAVVPPSTGQSYPPSKHLQYYYCLRFFVLFEYYKEAKLYLKYWLWNNGKKVFGIENNEPNLSLIKILHVESPI